MSVYTIAASALILIIGLSVPVGSQVSNSGSTQINTQRSSPSGGKVALIRTEEFYDTQTGITRLINTINSINQEFQPRRDELKKFFLQYQTLNTELNKLPPTTDLKLIEQKRNQAASIERSLKYKSEDAQRDYDKRIREVIVPLSEHLGKSITLFAEQRGIALLLDASKLEDVILYASDNVDITGEFIKEYNHRNPTR